VFNREARHAPSTSPFSFIGNWDLRHKCRIHGVLQDSDIDKTIRTLEYRCKRGNCNLTLTSHLMEVNDAPTEHFRAQGAHQG